GVAPPRREPGNRAGGGARPSAGLPSPRGGPPSDVIPPPARRPPGPPKGPAMTRRTLVPCALLFALAAVGWPAEKAPGAHAAGAVASVGGETIDAAELESSGAAKLFAIYTQEYQLRKQLLDEIINKRLLDKEAKKRGISVDELARVEVDGKAAPV